MNIKLVILVLVFLTGTSFCSKGKRSFIGIDLGYKQKETYSGSEGAKVVFYDNFCKTKINKKWQINGNIPFFTSNRSLKAKLLSRKKLPKSGSLVLKKDLSLKDGNISFKIKRNIPNRTPSISSAIFFSTSGTNLNEQNRPIEYIMYFKRSQIEYIESKEKNGRPKLIWGRNKPIESGEYENIEMTLTSKDIILKVDGKILCEQPYRINIKHKVINPGIWVSTKGESFGIGNISFDEAIIELLPEKMY